jgi:hypothetical protein
MMPSSEPTSHDALVAAISDLLASARVVSLQPCRAARPVAAGIPLIAVGGGYFGKRIVRRPV